MRTTALSTCLVALLATGAASCGPSSRNPSPRPQPDPQAPLAESPTPALPPTGAPPGRYGFTHPAMGTEFRLLLYAPDEPTARAAAAAALDRVAELDRNLLSDQPGTDLHRLHAAAAGPPVPVGPDLLLVLRKGIEIARLSNGAYNPTAAPAGARRHVNWQSVRLDPAAGTAQLLAPGMRLDLTEVARGYAADAALATLRGHGIASALVQAGGDIVVGDGPPGESGWRVVLEHADPAALPSKSNYMVLSNAGVSSRTRPSPVTVVAPNGLTSAPLAAAAVVLGPRKGAALLDQFDGTQAFFRTLPAPRP